MYISKISFIAIILSLALSQVKPTPAPVVTPKPVIASATGKEPTNPPTLPPVIEVVPKLQKGSVPVTVIITTDDYPQETSYQVQQVGTQAVFMAGGGYTGERITYTNTKNLPYGVYLLIISDSFGDGICCTFGNGGYNLFVNNVLKKAGGNFLTTETYRFSTGSASPTTPPTLAPTPVPTKAPSPVPTNAPTLAPVDGCAVTTVLITTDDYPEETTYVIKNMKGVQFLMGGGYTNKRAVYSANVCLPYQDTYQLVISDAKCDGMCCAFGNGGYNLFVGGTLVAKGDEFLCSKTVTFSSGSPPTFAPTFAPTTIAPTKAPVPKPPTRPPSETCCAVTVIVTTDKFPLENFYEVIDMSGNLAMFGGPFTAQSTTFTKSECVAPGVYQFTIFDRKGDGLCCKDGPGGYNVFADGALVSAGGQFGSSDTIQFSCKGAPFVPVAPITRAPTFPPTLAPTPVPTNAPTPVPTTLAPTNVPTSKPTKSTKAPSKAPVAPPPTEPAPTEPAPTKPTPIEPAPTEPAPTDKPGPPPTDPAPIEPAPTEPVSTDKPGPPPTVPAPTEAGPAPTGAEPSPPATEPSKKANSVYSYYSLHYSPAASPV